MVDFFSLRISASVLAIVTHGLASCLVCNPTFGGLSIVIAAFFWQWYAIHGRGLTRSARAVFDESNILETYQPRARTMGHLFETEPPTPVPAGTQKTAKSDFNALRDAHYENEYLTTERLAKEAKESEESGTAAPSANQNKSQWSESCRVELRRDPEDDEPADEV